MKKNNKKIEKKNKNRISYKDILLIIFALVFVYILFKVWFLNKYSTSENLSDSTIIMMENYEIKTNNESDLMDLGNGVKMKKLPEKFLTREELCKTVPYSDCELDSNNSYYTLLYDGTYEKRAIFGNYVFDTSYLKDGGFPNAINYEKYLEKYDLFTMLDTLRYLKSRNITAAPVNNFFTPVYKIKENYIIYDLINNFTGFTYELTGDYEGYVMVINPRHYIQGVTEVTSVNRVGFDAIYVEIFKNNKTYLFTFWNSDQSNVFNESNINEYLNSIVIE